MQILTWVTVSLFILGVALAATKTLQGLHLLIFDYFVANFLTILAVVNIFIESRALGHTDIPIVSFWMILSAVASIKIMIPQHPVQFYTSSRILTIGLGSVGLLLLKHFAGYSAMQLAVAAGPTVLVGVLANGLLAWLVLTMQRRYLQLSSAHVGVPLPRMLSVLTDRVLERLSDLDKLIIPITFDLFPRGLNMTHSYMYVESEDGLLQRMRAKCDVTWRIADRHGDGGI